MGGQGLQPEPSGHPHRPGFGHVPNVKYAAVTLPHVQSTMHLEQCFAPSECIRDVPIGIAIGHVTNFTGGESDFVC